MKLIGDNHRCPSKRNHIQFNWDLVFQVSDLCLIKFSQMGIDHQYGGKYIYINIYIHIYIPSGKLTVCYGKSPFSMGKSAINGPFSIAACMFTRGYIHHMIAIVSWYIQATFNWQTWYVGQSEMREIHLSSGHLMGKPMMNQWMERGILFFWQAAIDQYLSPVVGECSVKPLLWCSSLQGSTGDSMGFDTSPYGHLNRENHDEAMEVPRYRRIYCSTLHGWWFSGSWGTQCVGIHETKPSLVSFQWVTFIIIIIIITIITIIVIVCIFPVYLYIHTCGLTNQIIRNIILMTSDSHLVI